MRAKTINEIQKFEQGIDPRQAMGTGKISEVKKMLDEVYNKHKYKVYEYNIRSLDHIEIRYSDDIKNDIRQGAGKGQENNVWIIKYVEKDRYIFKDESHEISSSTHSFGTSYEWNIYEVQFYMSDNPESIKFKNAYVFDLTMKNDLNKERAQIMVDALNKHYGKVGGFELIEKTKDAS
jgi:hypothetical protein